jgi:iron complex transport system substrate-binding protein
VDMKRTKPVLVALACLVALLPVACGTSTPAGDATASAPTPDRGGRNLTVVDALDRAIQFPTAPQRIVVAGKSSLTLINTLFLYPQAAERVVGLVVGQQNPADFLTLVDPGFGEKATLAVEAGPEQIAPLQPDVVILRSFMAEKLGGPLEQLDIPVVYVDLETPEQFLQGVAILGQLLGSDARAEEIVSFYRSQLDRLEARLQGMEEGQRPRTLLLQYSDQGGEVALSVPSAAWIQTAEVELAGGMPVWKEAAPGGGWTVVNLEQIAAWDPDKIFVISYKTDASTVVATLEADSRWQALTAARDGELFGFGGDVYSWDQPDPRWILGVTWLAAKMHPDRFSDLDMVGEVSRFYEEMYGLDASSIGEEILPNLRGDVE